MRALYMIWNGKVRSSHDIPATMEELHEEPQTVPLGGTVGQDFLYRPHLGCFGRTL